MQHQTEQNKPHKIICPICGSEHIAFTEEYHKDIINTVFSIISFIAGTICFAFYIKNSFNIENTNHTLLIPTIICFFFSALFYIAKLLTERKTHTKGICKDCGNIWLLD